MPLPLKGDPHRPIHLAARSMRLVGVLLVVVGSIFTFAAIRRVSAAHSDLLGADPAYVIGYIIGNAVVYVVPGALLLFCARYVLRRRMWALIGSLIITGGLLLLMSLAEFLLIARIITNHASTHPLVRVAVQAVVIAALVTILYNLSRSFSVFKRSGSGESRGFEALPVPAIPSTEGDADAPSPER